MAVVLHPHMVGGDGGDRGDTCHHIGQMPQGVFQILGSGVRHLSEGAEGGHIDKGAAVQLAHIPGAGDSVPCGQGRCLDGLGREVQRYAAVVRRACGKKA